MFPSPGFREVFDHDSVWDRFIGWAGYVDGEPVSTAATVMRHAVAEAQRQYGLSQTILQSTPAGHRLYERMGFRTVTNIAVYAS